VTNALNIALELSGLPNIRVMMLGGLLRQTSYSLVGPDAEQALSRFPPIVCFWASMVSIRSSASPRPIRWKPRSMR
jgi:DeoR/GlpR family transcriptional regulator of sugar metabolism